MSEEWSPAANAATRFRRVVSGTLERFDQVRFDRGVEVDEYFFEALGDCARQAGAEPSDLRALAMMTVQMMVEQTEADEYDRRDDLSGWICDHIAGERLIVRLTHGDRVLMVEFPDQQKVM